VAAAAGIHPSMVMRYYGSKEGLFAAAATFDLEIPDLSKVPREQIGRSLIRHFMQRWEAQGEELPALLRASVTHEQARERLLLLFRDQVTPALAKVCGPERAPLCAALVATQTIGLALTRYVLRFPPIVTLPEDVIVDRIGATMQAYLASE
jgi:AcrR family transcriptional regulator